MGYRFNSRLQARVFTWVLIFGALLGGSLPELGNLAARWLGIEYGHYFNTHFLVAGLLGIIGCGIALYRRRNNKGTVYLRRKGQWH